MIVSENGFSISNSPQTLLNLICLTMLVIITLLTQLQPKISATNLEKGPKSCLPS